MRDSVPFSWRYDPPSWFCTTFLSSTTHECSKDKVDRTLDRRCAFPPLHVDVLFIKWVHEGSMYLRGRVLLSYRPEEFKTPTTLLYASVSMLILLEFFQLIRTGSLPAWKRYLVVAIAWACLTPYSMIVCAPFVEAFVIERIAASSSEQTQDVMSQSILVTKYHPTLACFSRPSLRTLVIG